MADEAPAGSCLTFLGDLIDRGSDNLGCLRLAARPAGELGFGECHVLFGNHETMMLRAMGTQDNEQRDAFRLWTDNGGWATTACCTDIVKANQRVKMKVIRI